MRNENKHDGKNRCEYGNKFICMKVKKNKTDILPFIPCQEAISESGHEIL